MLIKTLELKGIKEGWEFSELFSGKVYSREGAKGTSHPKNLQNRGKYSCKRKFCLLKKKTGKKSIKFLHTGMFHCSPVG